MKVNKYMIVGSYIPVIFFTILLWEALEVVISGQEVPIDLVLATLISIAVGGLASGFIIGFLLRKPRYYYVGVPNAFLDALENLGNTINSAISDLLFWIGNNLSDFAIDMISVTPKKKDTTESIKVGDKVIKHGIKSGTTRGKIISLDGSTIIDSRKEKKKN